MCASYFNPFIIKYYTISSLLNNLIFLHLCSVSGFQGDSFLCYLCSCWLFFNYYTTVCVWCVHECHGLLFSQPLAQTFHSQSSWSHAQEETNTFRQVYGHEQVSQHSQMSETSFVVNYASVGGATRHTVVVLCVCVCVCPLPA